jgi:hypothetical protein
MAELDVFTVLILGDGDLFAPPKTKKAHVIECYMTFDDVGLLANEPPGTAGLLFI